MFLRFCGVPAKELPSMPLFFFFFLSLQPRWHARRHFQDTRIRFLTCCTGLPGQLFHRSGSRKVDLAAELCLYQHVCDRQAGAERSCWQESSDLVSRTCSSASPATVPSCRSHVRWSSAWISTCSVASSGVVHLGTRVLFGATRRSSERRCWASTLSIAD